MTEVRHMSIPDKIIKEIDMLSEQEQQKELDKIKEIYMAEDVVLLGENYSWWDNEADDIYSEQ